MNTDTLLELLIQIVCTSIIGFAVQQSILAKMKKSEQKAEYKKKVIEEYLSLLQKAYCAIDKVKEAFMEEQIGEEIPFYSVWNPTQDAFEQLKFFLEGHPMVMGETDWKWKKSLELWDGMCVFLFEEARQKNNNVLSKELDIPFIEKRSEIMECLKHDMEKCEQYLLSL